MNKKEEWVHCFKFRVETLDSYLRKGFSKIRIELEDNPRRKDLFILVRVGGNKKVLNKDLILIDTPLIPRLQRIHLSPNQKIRLVGWMIERGFISHLSYREWGMIFNVTATSIYHYVKTYKESL